MNDFKLVKLSQIKKKKHTHTQVKNHMHVVQNLKNKKLQVYL